MRVGVVVEQTGAEYGGGYTFREEIYRALLESQEELSQDYVFVVRGEVPSYLQEVNHRCLEVPTPPQKNLFQRVFDKLMVWKQPVQHDLRPRIDGDLLKETVDVLYFCYPDCIVGSGVPVVTTIWDLAHRYVPFFPELTENGNRELREDHFQMLSLQSDLFIVGTDRGQREMSQYFGVDSERQWKIKHPTPVDALNYEIGRAEAVAQFVSDDATYFVYPSQYWPHKNHVTLLKAWRRIADSEASPPKLLFTGSNQGNLEHVQNAIHKLGLEEIVIMTGFLERNDLLEIIAHSRAVLFPCLFGPENLPPLEAGALGVPTIISDVPGFREQLGDSAYFVEDPLDPDQWKEAVSCFLEDETLVESLSKRAKSRAEEFSAKDFVRELDVRFDRFSRIRALWG